MRNLRDQAQQLRWRATLRAGGPSAQYRLRSPVPLMLLVIALGLPIIGIPTWRQRLTDRTRILGEALASQGAYYAPLALQVGENKEPFPVEYERPAPSITPWTQAASEGPPAYVMRAGQPTEQAMGGVLEAAGEAPGAEAEIQYFQGPTEREAYELVLASNERLAALISGSGPEMRFKDWGAARADDESMLVRVTFTHQADQSERAYIWRVRLGPKEVVPLSAYAKAISGP